MTFTEIQATITEVATGFKALVDKTEYIEKLSEREDSMASAVEAIKNFAELGEQVVSINSSLGKLYALNNPVVIEQAMSAVKLAIQGKEEYLIVAGILTGGLDLGDLLGGIMQ